LWQRKKTPLLLIYEHPCKPEAVAERKTGKVAAMSVADHPP
jgi:hypothetical protein